MYMRNSQKNWTYIPNILKQNLCTKQVHHIHGEAGEERTGVGSGLVQAGLRKVNGGAAGELPGSFWEASGESGKVQWRCITTPSHFPGKFLRRSSYFVFPAYLRERGRVLSGKLTCPTPSFPFTTSHHSLPPPLHSPLSTRFNPHPLRPLPTT